MLQKLSNDQVIDLNEYLKEKELKCYVQIEDDNTAILILMEDSANKENFLDMQLAVVNYFKQKSISISFCEDNKRFSIVEHRKKIEVVAAIIQDGNRIFATQRGYGEFKDGWEFPGGKIETNETPQEALVREIKEELDTEIEVGELLHTVEFDYPKFHLTMHCFMCTIKSGDLVLREHEAAKWLTKESLDSIEWLPADLEVIGMI